MHLPKEYKIEQCCAHPNMHRGQFEQPFIDGENMIATDGRVMAIVPITREYGDTNLCRVPVAAIKAARKLPNQSIECGQVFKLSGSVLV